ncbi:nitrogenase-stabilizing/protective protein NifW [Haliea sp. E17]|uniref:nitrogenase-stabilizing/protective protein NifW n=1 Tax=Haliea sp. E17 TaxID=3401576 RepID=UPI003AAF3CE8
MNDELTLEDALEELSSAEDFLDYFDIPFDPAVVHVNRLHIMQRFHDYLDKSESLTDTHAGNDDAMAAAYKALLERAYQDFVESDALTEKVFKVFKTHGAQAGFVSVESLLEG